MSANNKPLIALILMISSWVSARAQGSEEVVKVDIALMTVNVSVTDAKGRPLPGLTPDDFLVTDEGGQVAVEFFDSQGPASVVFVIDTSASMKYEKWKNLKSGMKKYLARAHEGDDYTLVAFGDSPRLVAQSVSADELWRSFSELELSGNTALYDALLLGLEALGRAPRRHKALILLSDGQDNSSRAQLPDVEREALARRATVYAVGILPGERRGFPGSTQLQNFEREGKEILKQLAVASGGLASFPATGKIREVLEEINADARGQYSLSYYPADKAPGWRRVRVEITRSPRRLNLRYQERYLIR